MSANLSSKSRTIFILGCMTALSPFTIDMYLPAFPSMAQALHTTVSEISLSLSSYFVGLACGQLFYGPLLDRFGRKRPLYAGLLIYILASIGCLYSNSSESLIAWRFTQAIGGCAAGVAAMAMVRDLFPPHESAKVFSLLILILGTSPLLAPTIGGYLSDSFGWASVFAALILMSGALFLTVLFLLPESHTPDASVRLKVGPILKNYHSILKSAHFYTYAMTGAVAFSGLFVYLAGSTLVFMETYGVSGTVYGWIFAFIAAGLIGTSQVNVVLLNRFSNIQLLSAGLFIQLGIAACFFVGTYFDWLGLWGTVTMFFLFMSCFGVMNANATALSLAPFSKNAGSASALLGFLQMSVGATASMLIGLLNITQVLHIVIILLGTSSLALLVLWLGMKRIQTSPAEPTLT